MLLSHLLPSIDLCLLHCVFGLHMLKENLCSKQLFCFVSFLVLVFCTWCASPVPAAETYLRASPCVCFLRESVALLLVRARVRDVLRC